MNQAVNALKSVALSSVPGVGTVVDAVEEIGKAAGTYGGFKCLLISDLEYYVCASPTWNSPSLSELLTELQSDLSDGIPSADAETLLGVIEGRARIARGYFKPVSNYPYLADAHDTNSPPYLDSEEWQSKVSSLYRLPAGFLAYSLMPSLEEFAKGTELAISRVPEPASLCLGLLGLSTALVKLRRR